MMSNLTNLKKSSSIFSNSKARRIFGLSNQVRIQIEAPVSSSQKTSKRLSNLLERRLKEELIRLQ